MLVWSLLLAVLAITLLWGCQPRAATPPAPSPRTATNAPSVEADPGPTWPPQLADLAARARDRFAAPTISVRESEGLERPLVLDVRTEAEIAVSHIEGSLPLPSAAAREQFATGPRPDRPVLVYCTAGWRSAEYTRELANRGFEVWNLEGGICAWALEGLALVDAGGSVTRKIHSYSEDFEACVPAGYEAVTTTE